MKKIVLGATALAALSTTAFAADLPSRRAPPVFVPPPIPVFTWTGFYAGIQGGYAFGKSTGTFDPGNGGLTTGIQPSNSKPNGVVGGGHVGYLFSTQSLPVFGGVLGGGGVIGVEGDVNGLDYKATDGYGAVAGANFHRVRENIDGSIRGKLGIAVDRVLFYATGGAAFGTFNNLYANVPTGAFDSDSITRVGYTVGGGVEYAFTNNLSAGVEYRYTDYGTFTDADPAGLANGVIAGIHRETQQRVIGSLSYHFTTPVAPVVARY